jgi:hypothetical protein
MGGFMRRLEFVFARLLPLAVLVTALVGAP